MADVDKIPDNHPFDQVVKSLLKVQRAAARLDSRVRSRASSPELREQTVNCMEVANGVRCRCQ